MLPSRVATPLSDGVSFSSIDAHECRNVHVSIGCTPSALHDRLSARFQLLSVGGFPCRVATRGPDVRSPA